ncbi:MAG: VanW family protein [Actinomycetales bacterium]|uniref:VanW family protein n=1 Tax=Candidatus Phosphoribacter hodrii TaxID=2953743 RepID=A0A935MI14_9MICO|nr:VanW family protein [Candidatus Phosphoribacter hodrii]
MREWSRIVVRSVVAVAILVGAYVAVAWWTGRQVPAALVVEGVSVGGMSTEQAAERLTTELAGKAKTPIRVDLAGTQSSVSIDPVASGLSFDIPGTLDGLTGFTLDPTVIWARLSGRTDRPILVKADEPRLLAALTEKAATVQTTAVDGTVSFAGGKVATTPAVDGVALQLDDAVRKVVQAWPRVESVTAAASITAPKVTKAKVDAAVTSFAAPAMSGPVTIVVGDKTAVVTPEQYAEALSMVPDESGTLNPVVDKEALRGVVASATSAVVVAPKDATIVLEGDKPVIRPSVDGVSVDTASAADLLVKALTAPDRRVSLSTVAAKATLTTEGAQALGVREVIASFDSAYPYDPPRTNNMTLGAAAVNGTLIKPGEVFSLNKVMGERTSAKGYQEAGVISNNRLTKNVGGGVSQISTVTYNLAWFAGVELTAHKAHSFYISRYPAGREATVSWPDLDNKWTNNSPYGILVQMWLSGGQVHGRMWSTKVYDVTAVAGPRTNIKHGRSITDSSPSCVPHAFTDGFDITVQRVFSKGGSVVKRESYSTTYVPADQIICSG